MRVIASSDCGNSPKNKFVQSLSIALAKGDVAFILGKVTDDIRWEIVGDKTVFGKDEFAAALKRMKDNAAVELTIQHVLTHGRAGAVNGTFKLTHGRKRAFCDVYGCSGANGKSVKEITSYIVEIQ